MIDINLLPERIRRRRQRAVGTALRVLGIIIVVAGMAGAAGLMMTRLQALRAEAAALDEQAAQFQGALSAKKDLDDLLARVDERQKLEAGKRGTTTWSLALRDIALAAPAAVALDTIRTTSEGKMVVDGRAADLVSLAQFIDGLKWHRYTLQYLKQAARGTELGPFVFTLEIGGWQGGG